MYAWGKPDVLVGDRNASDIGKEAFRVSKELLDAIPQTDPRAGYLTQRPAIDAAIARVLEIRASRPAEGTVQDHSAEAA